MIISFASSETTTANNERILQIGEYKFTMQDLKELSELKKLKDSLKIMNEKLKIENENLKNLGNKILQENKSNKKLINELLKQNEDLKSKAEIASE